MPRRKRALQPESPSDRPKIGEPFNPFRGFRTYVIIPDPIFKHGELSVGAKFCYGRLLRYSGETARCYPRIATIAKELGVSDRTIQTYLRDLENQRLIRRVKRDGGKSNQFLFLWHESFETG